MLSPTILPIDAPVPQLSGGPPRWRDPARGAETGASDDRARNAVTVPTDPTRGRQLDIEA